MPAERRVRLFKNGRNQAVRIPRGYELPGKEAILRKDGERLIIEPAPLDPIEEALRLIIEPAPPKSLLALLDTLDPIEEDFPPITDQPPEPVEF